MVALRLRVAAQLKIRQMLCQASTTKQARDRIEASVYTTPLIPCAGSNVTNLLDLARADVSWSDPHEVYAVSAPIR